MPFDDSRIREAVFLAIDEVAIWEELSYFPNGDHYVDSQLPFDHGAIRGYDPEKAKQLLAETGYPDGFETGLCLFSTVGVPQGVPEYIAAMMREIGIICGIADSGPMVVTDDVIENREGTPIYVPSPPAPAPTGTKIVFEHNYLGRSDIGVMNADGTGNVVYLTDSGTNRSPAVSPDGTKIAFIAYRDGSQDIYVMNTDGSNQTRLTNSSGFENYASWSPDGKKIAFQSYRDGTPTIYVMNADGSGQTRLTNVSSTAVDAHPAWSPDGKQLAFSSRSNTGLGIHVINADGSGRTTLSNTDDDFPAWSPDGSKLVFISNRDGHPELYEMNADGSGQKRLMSDESHKKMPSYSPDGKKIAFSKNIGEWLANGGGNYDIHTINTDGTGLTKVTDNSIQGGYVTFATHKERHFNVDRLGIFKYLVLGRESPGALGIAEFPFGGPNKGDDFWVALATWSSDPSRIASVTMHELGHDLGLAHGGHWPNPSHNTFKPNFPSIMNYRYTADGIPTGCNTTPDGLLTFSQGQMKEIDETATDENIGICDNKSLDMNGDDAITSGEIDSDNTVRYSDPRDEIYVMNADGSNRTRLTNNSRRDKYPSWSPDGTKIAFASERDGDGIPDIYVMYADGSNQTQLTFAGTIRSHYGGTQPSWSPDGKKIAFVYGWDGVEGIHKDYNQWGNIVIDFMNR